VPVRPSEESGHAQLPLCPLPPAQAPFGIRKGLLLLLGLDRGRRGSKACMHIYGGHCVHPRHCKGTLPTPVIGHTCTHPAPLFCYSVAQSRHLPAQSMRWIECLLVSRSRMYSVVHNPAKGLGGRCCDETLRTAERLGSVPQVLLQQHRALDAVNVMADMWDTWMWPAHSVFQ